MVGGCEDDWEKEKEVVLGFYTLQSPLGLLEPFWNQLIVYPSPKAKYSEVLVL
jgi:hypothetical protein